MNLNFEEPSTKQLIIIFLSIIVGINLIFLNITVIRGLIADSSTSGKTIPVIPTVETVEIQPSPQNTKIADVCPNSCITQIYNATQSSQLVVPTSTPSATQSFGNKEFYIPLGSGSSTASDWQDVDGVAAYVDSSNFSSIKSVVFEASVHTPTGNQSANIRLYNKTDSVYIPESEVSIDGGGTKLLTSKSFSLASGNKLYQVQMKTQLKYQTILDQARIHIITN